MAVQSSARPSAGTTVIEVDERSFQEAVLERSRSVPVVVDFWAPWCGPCRVLGPTLERLAADSKGAFVLAKINVDENQRLSQVFRVQGIPAVKAFKDGRVVDEFTGALPETQVRAWLKRFVSAPSDDLLAAAAALEASSPSEAAARYRVALGSDPDNDAALLALGRLLVKQGDAEGVATLRQMPSGSPLYARAQAWLALADFFAEANRVPRGHAASTEQDARFRQAAAQASAGDYASAIEGLLDIVARDRQFREDGARKTLLALFEALGDDPIVGPARRRLANLLF